ncbi:MAG: RHS repeat-associated core domain-containing protein [Byssovorax sp.]
MKRLATLSSLLALLVLAGAASAQQIPTLDDARQFSNNPTVWCGNLKAPPPPPPGTKIPLELGGCDESLAPECPVSAAGGGGITRGSMDLFRGSKRVTVSMTWIGEADDAAPMPRQSAGVPKAPRPPEPGALARLSLRRFTDLRRLTYPSSFGPGDFSSYDLSLWLSRTNPATGGGTIVLNDPRDIAVRPLYDEAVPGLYVDKNFSSVESLKLYDAGGNQVIDQALAATGVVTARNGYTYVFEIIRTGPNPNTSDRYGRLVAERDRNGNGVTITYEHAANASDAALGFDRTRLWRMTAITDAYGDAALVSYRATKKSGRWVVETITLPSLAPPPGPAASCALVYLYDVPANGIPLAGLTRVIHQDGTESSRFITPDNPISMTVFHSFEPMTANPRRAENVYLTNPSWVDPVTGQVTPQTANLVRIIANAQNEVTYLNKSVFNAQNGNIDYFLYDGGRSLSRYRTLSWGVPLRLEQIVGWATLNQDPATFDFATVMSFTTTGFQRLTSVTDAKGFTTKIERDVITGAPTKVTHPDGKSSTTSYNGFRLPLLESDFLGVATAHTYDPKGNETTTVLAQGTPAQGVLQRTFNARGQVVDASDANGHVTNHVYFPNGRLQKITEPAVSPGVFPVTSYQYDQGGRIALRATPDGLSQAYTHDCMNRVTRTAYDDGTEELTQYGLGPEAGLLRQESDRRGVATEHLYDPSGREAVLVQALGSPEQVMRTWGYLPGTWEPSVTTMKGETTSYDHDDYNAVFRETVYPNTLTALHTTTEYDENHRARRVIDPHGRQRYSLYDMNGRLIRTVQEMAPGFFDPPLTDAGILGLVREPEGQQSPHYIIHDLMYDAGGHEVRRALGRGTPTYQKWDERGRVTLEMVAAGSAVQASTTNVYDPQGNVVHVIGPRGYLTSSTYTDGNLLKSKTDADGANEAAQQVYGHDAGKRVVNRTDGLGNTWTTVYGPLNGYAIAEIDPPADVDGDPSTPPSRAVHGKIRDPLGHIIYEYTAPDESLFVDASSYDHPPGVIQEITTRYDKLYRAIARTAWLVHPVFVDPLDSDGPPIAVDPSEGLTTRWVYDDDLADGQGLDAEVAARCGALPLGDNAAGIRSDGSAVQETGPAGAVRLTVYDGLGRVICLAEKLHEPADYAVTHTSYDTLASGIPFAPGDLVDAKKVDALGHETHEYRDGADRVLATRDAEQHLSGHVLDAECNPVLFWDSIGVRWTRAYDVRGREISRTDAAGSTIHTMYDADGNITAVTDALGHAKLMAYDGRNRNVGETDRLGGLTTFAYDAENLVSRTDAEGKVTQYLYDARKLQIGQVLPDGAFRAFAHDAAKRLVARTGADNQTIEFRWDGADRMTARTYPDGANDTFQYDDVGHHTSGASARYGNTVTRTWDPRGRMTAETLTIAGRSYTVEIGYDADNNRTSVTYPDGSVVSRSFTVRHQVEAVSQQGSLVAFFGYDAVKRRTTTDLGNGLHESRTYYDDDRIHTIAAPNVTGFGYVYDLNKNPLSRSNNAIPGEDEAYAYDPEDRLTSFDRTSGRSQDWALTFEGDFPVVITDNNVENRTYDPGHKLTARNGALLAYDPKGNVIGDGQGNTFAWDFDDQLESATISGVETQYQYDAFGRRVRTGNVIYVYDHQHAIAEYAAGALPDAPEKRYVFGDGQDELLAMIAGAARYYAHGDHLGSVYALTNQAGQVVERYRYDAYGNQTVSAGPGPDGLWFTADDAMSASAAGNPHTYTGQRFDAETGLLYYKSRYYRADLSRFLSRDPLHYADDRAYLYGRDNPIANADPSGGTDMPSCGKCCMVVGQAAEDWNALVILDASRNPSTVTGVSLYLVGQTISGAWTSGLYKLATDTRLVPETEYWYSVPADRDLGALQSGDMLFSTFDGNTQGTYTLPIAIYSGP